MTSNTQGSKLLQGAFILSAAAIFSKLIGTLQKIPLQNMGGDAAFGIYNTVYPLYTILVTVAMLGLPAAISRFVAEASAAQDTQKGRRVLLLSAGITAASGLCSAFWSTPGLRSLRYGSAAPILSLLCAAAPGAGGGTADGGTARLLPGAA